MPYRHDNPASIVVQKPQWSGARCWPAWASYRKSAAVKTARADKRMRRLCMGMRLAEIVVE